MAEVKFALRLHNLMIEISQDPDLDSNAKLFAYLVLADIAIGRSELASSEKLARRRPWMERVNTAAGSDYFCRSVIRADVPRYIGEPSTNACIAPMVRRDGPCGKQTYKHVWIRDPETGRRTREYYCTRHWSLDHEKRSRDLHDAWEANGSPEPPANSGGVLRRHLSTNWDELYDWADPGRRSEGGKEPTPPRPKLSLIQGGAS